MHKVDLKNKSYEQFFSQKKSGATTAAIMVLISSIALACRELKVGTPETSLLGP